MKLIKNIVSEFTTFGADSIFNELITNKTFIAEAREARKQIKKHPSSFTNFTEKFSSLID
ncbi:hypothetical protein HY439_01315 [Candidatus Microgenomates bacterium]|nr:hypothetical protein [Candidatus Microgenomates bacterium]